MLIDPGNTYIGTLRATGDRHEPLALRIRLERMLAAADLQPSGLPMHAIVCIRKFRTSLPGRWRSQAGGLRPPLDWERGMPAALDQLVRRAAHPRQSAVPANAEAVVFADYAELLACLANDWCEGYATVHWWWQSILRGQDVAHAVLSTWREAPEYAPAALQYLAGRARAVTFAHALPTHEASGLVQSITRRFALSAVQAALEAGEQARRTKGDTMPMTDAPAPLATQFAGQTAPDAPPWQSWVPESIGSGLHFEQQCLLGIGLTLQRAPSVVRTPAFALALWHWSQAAGRPQEDKASRTMPGPEMTGEAGREPTSAGLASAEVGQADLGTTSTTQTLRERDDTPSPLAGEGQDGGEPWPGVWPVEPSLLEPSDKAHTDAAFDLSVPPACQMTPPPVALSAPEPRSADAFATVSAVSSTRRPGALESPDLQIDTELGGLFYLINVGLFLDLYGDFTTPAQPGIALPLWDFVTLLGQNLVGEELHADAVWGLLAQLSGRSEQVVPGADFEPPERWRLPVEWLAPFPEDAIWRWQAIDGRLQVRHPAQFLVLDVPLQSADPALQLRCALQDYGAELAVELHSEPVTVDATGTAPLERWLGWLMPYVRARLQRAMPIADANELGRFLCAHHASVFVTGTHVDILLALDALPIEIRLAGLDRDPGWVPAAGRFIAFHFE